MSLTNPTAWSDFDRLAEQFARAVPYPHVIIDGFLRPDVFDRVHDEARIVLSNVDASNEITQRKKVACTDWELFGNATHQVISYLNSSAFIKPLERICGIDGLIGDPWLDGGGIHQTARGGFLKMHTDFNWNSKLRLDRRINALLYLNRNWDEAWGGELELADEDVESTAKIAPLGNRLVIFNTNDRTLHGHPEPLGFPEDYPRASIAMYYYSSGLDVPERKRVLSTTTRYVPRHSGDIDLRKGSLRSRLGYMWRRFTRFG